MFVCLLVCFASTRVSTMFQPTIKNFKINFNALNQLSTFTRGDLMTGQISFELTKETKIASITMTVRGKAKVDWVSSGGGRKKRGSPQNAKLDLLELESVILQGDNAVRGTPKLQPGTHVYPFSCQIPYGDFPPSFCGSHGKIVYTATVGINRPWHFSKDFTTEFLYAHHHDVSVPYLRVPLSGSNAMTPGCLWCTSGPVEMAASTEKQAFIPGETVKIICDIRNASFRAATPKVKLVQKQTFYSYNRDDKKVVPKYLASVTGEVVGPHTCNAHTEMSLLIPTDTPLTISNCSIIVVEYYIEASLSLRATSDLTVIFPIILCDTPVNPDPPPYSK